MRKCWFTWAHLLTNFLLLKFSKNESCTRHKLGEINWKVRTKNYENIRISLVGIVEIEEARVYLFQVLLHGHILQTLGRHLRSQTAHFSFHMLQQIPEGRSRNKFQTHI